MRPRLAPDWLVALAGAALLVATGVIGWDDATDEAQAIGPTLALLGGLLVLGDGCERAGLFDALAARIAVGAGGSPQRLLALVFAAAAAVTAVLGLDATVVLLTPAAFAAARRARLDARPSLYACTHLANTASVLLPVSNLTNLLAFRAADVSFAHFAALMVAALGGAARRRVGRPAALVRGRARGPARPDAEQRAAAAARAARSCSRRRWPASLDRWARPRVAGGRGRRGDGSGRARRSRRRPAGAIDVPLLVFVLGLAIIVRAVGDHGVGDLAADLLPTGDGLLALLGATLVAAVLANLLNNVPAVLLLLPAAAAAGPATVLAVLIGVNAGPNLTPTGSLATLLWRRVLRDRDAEPSLGEFLKLGALTVPPALVLGTVGLWLALQVIG